MESRRDRWGMGTEITVVHRKRSGMILSCALLVTFVITVSLCGQAWSEDPVAVDDTKSVMHPDRDTLLRWIADYENAPKAVLDANVSYRLSVMREQGVSTSLDLLSNVPYLGPERDQGYCGNCWVWAGTGLMEIAHSVQNSVDDRLSIQYLDSCKTDAFACNGGNLTSFATWYGGQGHALPWSNSNAFFVDGTVSSAQTKSTRECGTISTVPHYPFSSITAQTIATAESISQAQAIANIKNVLNQNKGVNFGMHLANSADWSAFQNFWKGSAEPVLWNPDNYCGHTYDINSGGGHALVVVGYNDDDPNPDNQYWTVLNSWGTTTGRPTGLFRMKMNMNYGCMLHFPGSSDFFNYQFQTMSISFTSSPSADYTIAASPTSVAVAKGGVGSTTVTTTVSNGFTNDITLSATGLPPKVTAVFSPTTIVAPGSGSSTLTFSVNSTASTETDHIVTVTGASSGGAVKHDSRVALTIIGLPSPVLASEPPLTPGSENTVYWSRVTPSLMAPGLPTQVISLSRVASSSAESKVVRSDTIQSSNDTNTEMVPSEYGLSGKSSDETGRKVIGHNLQQPVSVTKAGSSVTDSDNRIIPLSATHTSGEGVVPLVPMKRDQGFSASQASTTVLSETFEGAFPGVSWGLSMNPTWGSTGVDKHTGSKSGWCGGSSLNPANGYGNNMDSWMVYGPFSLSGATSASVNFWFKNLSELNKDYFAWFASVDNYNYYGSAVSGNWNSWQSYAFDLSNVYMLGDLRGKSEVWIAFYFTSDDSTSGPAYTGAYVDDIVISKETAPLPDLTVSSLSSWNDKIPVSRSQLNGVDPHRDVGPYYDNGTLYFNWSSLNQGTTVATGYNVHIEVTGTGGGSWDISSLETQPGKEAHLSVDQAFGPLAAGSHTLKIWIDSGNMVSESDETNNYYERTITVSRSTADLMVNRLPNWNDKIPVGTSRQNGTDAHGETGPYYDDQTLYFNWSLLNQGSTTASGYKLDFKVMDTGGDRWEWSSLETQPDNEAHLSVDQAFGPLSAGTHTLKIRLDSDNAVHESDESNNYYERTIMVQQRVLGYNAECADNPQFQFPISSGWTTQLQWVFAELTPGKTYYYRVKDISHTMESDWSTLFEKSQQVSALYYLPAKGQLYDTFKDLYGSLHDGEIVEADARGSMLSEDYTLDKDVSLTMRGGYDLSLNPTTGSTTLRGVITVRKGVLTLDRFILR